ncbi:DUF3306 domain-containing protein [Azospirillum picis]|uniref:DUF3306 domain-containing protein n=1 Tax=Azospirillum picis TaxID=488438 RepID=A0ABU0MF39_9PROT|nr:DUF3306 domain-containing protein [Azospirillum picis]MBP2298204.1 hypothetical protein [Azospirillum picis]MDQ0532042.1 hypothetical protein [Azospirillum picis]
MSGEAFLSRWSRLKRTTVEPKPEAEPKPDAPVAPPPAEMPVEAALPVPADPAAALPPEAAVEEAPQDDPLKDLPPVEELTGASDFTPFLRAEVPEDLHRQALRKLWTSDPVYANDDGLKDYADDYASLFTGNDPVKTLYRVGKGFIDQLDHLDEVAQRAEEAAVADAPDASVPQPPPPAPRGEG